jgi:hypothetical protein
MGPRVRVNLALLLPEPPGELVHALADAMLIRAEVVLALVDLVTHLLPPVEGVRVAGDRGLCRNTAPVARTAAVAAIAILDLATAGRTCIACVIGLLGVSGGRFA